MLPIGSSMFRPSITKKNGRENEKHENKLVFKITLFYIACSFACMISITPNPVRCTLTIIIIIQNQKWAREVNLQLKLRFIALVLYVSANF